MKAKHFSAWIIALVVPICMVAQKTSASNCGCEYMPLCNYTAKITYKNLTYYGIKGSENKDTYYRCEGGIITMLWTSESEVFAGTGYDYNPFSRSETPIHYYDVETNYHYEPVLNYNLPVGGKWKVPNTNWEYQVMAKGIEYKHEGKVYKNVIRVRVTRGVKMSFDEFLQSVYAEGKDDIYYEGRSINASQDKYWAKGVGFLESVNTFDTIYNSFKGKKVSVELNKKRLLAKLKGVYASNPNPGYNEQLTYLGISKKTGISFLTAVDNGKYSAADYIEACTGSIDTDDRMYTNNYTLLDCEQKKWTIYTKENNGPAFKNMMYARDDWGFTVDSKSFPDEFSVAEFNERHKGKADAFRKVADLPREVIIAAIKKDYENKESKFRGDRDENLVGIWVYKEGQARQNNRQDFFRAMHFFRDGTYKQTVYSQQQTTTIEEGRWLAENKKIYLLTSLQQQIDDVFQKIARHEGPKFIADIPTMVGSNIMQYKIVENKRTNSITLSFTSNNFGSRKPTLYEKVTESEYRRMQ